MKRFSRILTAIAVFAALLVTAACGGGGGGGGTAAPGAFSLTSPAHMETGVSITPNLSWSASSGATGYSVQMKLSTASSYSTLANVTTTNHQVASALTASTSYDWRVTASNAGGTTGAGPFTFTTGPGGPISVNGTVVDSDNNPVSGANIILNNDMASLVTTGAEGTFSFSNVTPPYTLTMKSGAVIFEYRDLSRADPKLATSTSGAAYSAILAGSVTGPAYPLPAGQGILIGATNGVLTAITAVVTTGVYSNMFIWSGGPAKTTDLAALRFSYSGSLITGYSQFGVRTGVSLNSGVNQSGLDIALTDPVTTTSTILNYNLGAYTVGGNGEYFLLKANGAQFLVSGATIPSGTSVLLPSEGGTFIVQGKDAGGNQVIKFGAAVLGGTTILDLPASTVLKNSLPANGAVNVSRTPTLSWTPVSGADMYMIILLGAGLDYGFYLPGDMSSLIIPDYTAFGLPLAAGTNYQWAVLAFKSSGLSMDSVTDPSSSGVNLNLYDSPGLDLYTSAATNFTTAP